MPFKIVIADPSTSALKTLQMAFSETKHDLFLFKDGLEVEKNLSQLDPDAVIVNLSLPKKDGYEIGHYLNSHDQYRKVPLIFLLGAFDRVNKEKIESLDYVDIVQEPFDSEDLVRKVCETIGHEDVPQTLPEEPVLEKESSIVSDQGLEARVRRLVRAEVVRLEKDLEEKLWKRIVTRLKAYVDKGRMKRTKPDTSENSGDK
jgi:PleD family two-component response regulator